MSFEVPSYALREEDDGKHDQDGHEDAATYVHGVSRFVRVNASASWAVADGLRRLDRVESLTRSETRSISTKG